MKIRTIRCILSLLSGLLFFALSPLKAEGEDVFKQLIELPQSKGSIYKLLGLVTDHTGYLFIYDSDIINNEKKVKLKAGRYALREAIQQITGNSRLEMRKVGSHILLSLPVDSLTPPSSLPAQAEKHFTIEGRVCDRVTREPIAYGSIYTAASIGTISNLNGAFRLHLPDSLREDTIHFSHVGYEPQKIASNLLAGHETLISLEPKVISIQEVVVRLVNPQRLLHQMLSKLKDSYSSTPVYLTTFYREGIERQNSLVNLTEAVFKIYKTAYNNSNATDQIKLLKMRRITNQKETDTLITKMKSGINACLMLDLIKYLPDYLTLDQENPYTYMPTDLTVIDGRLVNVITFEQRSDIKSPLYRGEIYLDATNSALLSVQFEIHPNYVRKTANLFIEKKSRRLRITPQQISYTISYKNWHGTYYINHIRGDLHFKVKKKNQLFSSSPLHIWFEMATCKVDTSAVSRFPHSETIPSRSVFAETSFKYDKGFWEHFNIIRPEEKLTEAISNMIPIIEETEE